MTKLDATDVKRDDPGTRDGARLFSFVEWTALADRFTLSPRELQILKGVFADRTENAIGSDLGISHHTVHTYLGRIYRKLSVGSRTQLVIRVMSAYLDMTRNGASPGRGARPGAFPAAAARGSGP